MLSKDKRWMNKLRTCLKAMPSGMALHIKLNYTGNATFELCDDQQLHDLFSGESDLMKDSDSVEATESFISNGVHPNSECI